MKFEGKKWDLSKSLWEPVSVSLVLTVDNAGIYDILTSGVGLHNPNFLRWEFKVRYFIGQMKYLKIYLEIEC